MGLVPDKSAPIKFRMLESERTFNCFLEPWQTGSAVRKAFLNGRGVFSLTLENLNRDGTAIKRAWISDFSAGDGFCRDPSSRHPPTRNRNQSVYSRSPEGSPLEKS
jgi:hypothetical protein